MSKDNNRLSRRKFLQTGAFAAVATGLMPNTQQEKQYKEQKADPKKILNYNKEMRYRRLGDTDIYLSVISLGGIGFQRSIAHHAIDHGVNLVHMSTGYNGGNSMKELHSVLKEKRDKVYIAFKGSLKDIDDVLKKLDTDYIDFLMFNRHKASKVNDPKIPETFEKWKQQGKVRFAGLTTHKEVKACVATGIESSMYSLIQPVLNQPNLEAMTEELKHAHEKGVGIMAMKTMKGINDPDLQIAYLKKILRNPAVTTVNKTFPTFDLFNTFLKATQETLTSQEDFDLYRYAQKNRSNNCMMCGECERVCPQHIEISTLLRCKLYYYDQLGDLETAISTFKDIPGTRRYYTDCVQCRKCEATCPNGIQIVRKLDEIDQFFH